MENKEDLELLLRKWTRRVNCRSESRILSNKIFHMIFGILDHLNNRNEEELEKELESGIIEFFHNFKDCKMKATFKIIKVDEKI